VSCFINKYHTNTKHNYHVHKYDARGSHDHKSSSIGHDPHVSGCTTLYIKTVL